MDFRSIIDKVIKEHEGLEKLSADIEELEKKIAPEGETTLPM